MRGWALKQATRKASYLDAIGTTPRIAAAAERTPSRWPSMAEGVGWGAVKPVTVQYGGRVDSRERRHASVMEEVPLGLIKRMLIVLAELPVTEGSSGMFGCLGGCEMSLRNALRCRLSTTIRS